MMVRPSNTIVALMALGFGLVGIDRFLISALFPVIGHDLKLGYGAIGTITGVLALAWGFAALCMGNLSDRIGRRVVLAGSLLVFSLLIGLNGLAAGLLSLIAVRAAMGLADGAYTPVSIATTLEASRPGQQGRNIGIQQMMLPLCGLGAGPLIAVWLLKIIDWRWIFPCFALPGLLLSWAVARALPRHVAAPRGSTAFADWRSVIAVAEVRVCMAMMLCWLTCLVTTSALLPNYLTDYLHLPVSQMGQVLSAIGLGSAAGTLTLPWLSDRTGRRPVMLVSTAGTAVALMVLARIGPSPWLLFAALFAVHFFNNTLITLTVGPLCVLAVAPALAATASGVVIATGELFGGGIAPVLGGFAADRFGIQHVLWLPIGTSLCGFLLCFALRRTRT
jgi:predicted MFS family arabinose efflux permease